MKINPYIFAGLKEPKCQLYFDLQAMIAKNGGRLKLAQELESEMSKLYIGHKAWVVNRGEEWTKSETNFVANHYKDLSNTSIGEILDRTAEAVRHKIIRMFNNGTLKK